MKKFNEFINDTIHYFENQYNLKVSEAKRVANKGLDGSTYSIKGYDY